GQGWQDTITVKSNGTYSKRVALKEAGYYRINFYNQQQVDVILDKSNIEVNVDGNNRQGFSEVKGSPDIELIRKVQTVTQTLQSTAEFVTINNEFVKAQQENNQQRM